MTMFQIWYEVPLSRLEKLVEKMNQSPQSCSAALHGILRVTLEWIHWGPDKTRRNQIWEYLCVLKVPVQPELQRKVLPLCVTKGGRKVGCWNINCKALILGLSKQWQWRSLFHNITGIQIIYKCRPAIIAKEIYSQRIFSIYLFC